MSIFGCFSPPCAVKNKESRGLPKTIDGDRSSKINSRVKPIDVVCPSILQVSKKKRSKLNLRAKPTDIIIPSIEDGSKKRSKWGHLVKPTDSTTPSSEDGSKKRRSKWGLWVKHNDIVSPSAENGFKELYLPVSESFPSFEKIPSVSLKMIIDGNLSKPEPPGDKHDEIHLMRGDRSDLDLQPKGKLAFHGPNTDLNSHVLEQKTKTDEGITLGEMIVSGNTIDSWMLLKNFMESPLLKCSCSHIVIKQVKQLIKSPERSSSYNNLQNLCGNGKVECTCGPHISPLSVWTSHSADVVMLKRCYSIHVLPTRSRKIWWKHFLWSHGNLHRSSAPENLLSALSDANKNDGYLYDMHASDQSFDNMKNKAVEIENQWTAFSSQSSHMDRVSAWVKSLQDCSFLPVDVEEHSDEVEGEQIADEHGMEIGEFSVKKYFDTCQRETVDFGQANNIIHSLNSFSSVAHMSGIGLKVVPSISGFLYLRSANLSGNCIVQITPGSLPKSLHTLDLSRNKISTIEGIRHLEKLRVLNLSFNRISRISQGLSSCTLIKELYLAGNKISVVECLHRAQKLTVLDLSFNKITTTKALDQLVANYRCLLALDLTGNPVQANIGNDQLKREVLSFLPHVSYLNKQPIKPGLVTLQMNKLAKAALGDGHPRKRTRRLSQGSSSPSKRRFSHGSFRFIKYNPRSTHSSSGRVSSAKLPNGYFSVSAIVQPSTI
ncbi:putative disease resistance protein [Platanthera guangdongensis]|uniref:Disease resistance protein n=1 Tax=Platanthera guangdongensis TaxID=2320717 RepID=A0ABR2MR74_9ASPA